jgi:transposase
MVRTRTAAALDLWLKAVAESALPDLKSFADGLVRDKSAVVAALSQSWSNGQTEGQITRLKFLKRQMYGRANFDLLRLRMLHAP